MIRNLTLVLVVLFLITLAFAGTHNYISAGKCKMCHKGEKKGMIFEKWQESSHAKAYATLGEAAAKEVYTKLGKTGNPQEDADCLKCHVTGYGEDAALTAALTKDEGVGCEACHGAGADYKSMATMKDKALSIENGMVAEPKEGCVKCHNDQSPTFKGFDLAEKYPVIEHKRPQ